MYFVSVSEIAVSFGWLAGNLEDVRSYFPRRSQHQSLNVSVEMDSTKFHQVFCHLGVRAVWLRDPSSGLCVWRLDDKSSGLSFSSAHSLKAIMCVAAPEKRADFFYQRLHVDNKTARNGWLTANKVGGKKKKKKHHTHAATKKHDCHSDLEANIRSCSLSQTVEQAVTRKYNQPALPSSLCWNAGGSAAEASNLPPAVPPQKCQIRRAKWSTSVIACHCVQGLMLFHFALI